LQRYRLEKFPESSKIYQSLASSPDAEDETYDLRINRAAIDAQLEWKGLGHLVSNKKPQREDLEAFESAYNAACASIARGELGQAEVLLKRAKRINSAPVLDRRLTYFRVVFRFS
jgi:signal recognition particle subunit SRP72